jgi:hypothetical protein
MSGGPPDPRLVEAARRMFALARAGSTDELMDYLDHGAPVDLRNEKGDTMLLLAAYHGHAGTVAALLARGADHARVNASGQTALAAAVFKQDVDAVGHLLAAGADPDLGGQSARATARFFGLSAMEELLDRGDRHGHGGPPAG